MLHGQDASRRAEAARVRGRGSAHSRLAAPHAHPEAWPHRTWGRSRNENVPIHGASTEDKRNRRTPCSWFHCTMVSRSRAFCRNRLPRCLRGGRGGANRWQGGRRAQRRAGRRRPAVCPVRAMQAAAGQAGCVCSRAHGRPLASLVFLMQSLLVNTGGFSSRSSMFRHAYLRHRGRRQGPVQVQRSAAQNRQPRQGHAADSPGAQRTRGWARAAAAGGSPRHAAAPAARRWARLEGGGGQGAGR